MVCRATKLGVRWSEAYEYLSSGGGPSGIDAKQASILMARGWKMVDVRPVEDFEEHHASGSLNVPLYRKLTGNSPSQILKKVLLLSQGVTPLEPNSGFTEEALKVIKGSKGVVLVDAEGGSLEASPGFPYGKQCRSLTAAYLLLRQGGWGRKQLEFLAPGLNGWFMLEMPGKGIADKWQFNARTPSGAQVSGGQNS